MDNLKQFVDNNREAFRHSSPLPGHWLRFRMKTGRSGWRGQKTSFAQWASSTAAAVLLFAAMLPVVWPDPDNKSTAEKSEEIRRQAEAWFAESHPDSFALPPMTEESVEHDSGLYGI
jgi:hypothetical protein